MHTRFTPGEIAILDRDVKALRRSDPLLTQVQARDRIAQREGWPNWALLKKNAIPPGPAESLDLVVKPFEPGNRGVFFFKLAINDAKVLASVKRAGGLSFGLPALPQRWHIRDFLEGPDPYLDRALLAPRGRFVEGKFLCIVSTDGVEPAEIEHEINARLSLVSARIREAATESLGWLFPTPEGGQVKLIFSRPGKNGVREIAERIYSSLSAAQGAQLSPDFEPIGIPTEDGWWIYQPPFGWQAPPKKAA